MREERERSPDSGVERENIVDANLSHQNVRSLYQNLMRRVHITWFFYLEIALKISKLGKFFVSGWFRVLRWFLGFYMLWICLSWFLRYFLSVLGQKNFKKWVFESKNHLAWFFGHYSGRILKKSNNASSDFFFTKNIIRPWCNIKKGPCAQGRISHLTRLNILIYIYFLILFS